MNLEAKKSNPLLKVAILGSGNVAHHLYNALRDKALVTMLDPRKEYGDCTSYDVVLIAVSDRAIGEVASKLPRSEAIVAHTSGSTGIDVVAPYHEKCGVFYPLQTFTKGSSLDYRQIPFFIEATDNNSRERLRKLALLIGTNVYDADSEQRRQLHLASVFASNFVNHMYASAWSIMEKAGLPPEVLLPLIDETSRKIRRMEPLKAQTGPAARKDMDVIRRHSEMLEHSPQLSQLYKEISESIIQASKSKQS